MLSLAGYLNDQGLLFYLISCGGTLGHLTWQIRTLRESDPGNALKRFKSNVWVGLLIALGILADGVAN